MQMQRTRSGPVWFDVADIRSGSPDARETALLRLAELELGEGERLEVLSSLELRCP